MTVKLYSICFNRPDLMQMQVESFKFFLKDKHEIIFVNNAPTDNVATEIKKVADSLECRSIRVQTKLGNNWLPGKNHADAMNLVLRTEFTKDQGTDLVGFMDNDFFMVLPFSIEEHMKGGVTMSGVKQRRENFYYLTPNLLFMNKSLLPNIQDIDLEGVHINGVALDTGGGLYNYFEKYPQVKAGVKGIAHTWVMTSDRHNTHNIPDELIAEYKDDYVLELYQNSFLHYCRSSNWDQQSYDFHKEKTGFVRKFVYGSMSGLVHPKKLDFQIVDSIFGWDGL